MKNGSNLEIIFDLLNKYDEGGRNYERFEEIREKDILFPTELFNERWLIKIFLFLAKEKKFKNTVKYMPDPNTYKNLRYISEVSIGALEKQGHTKADGLIGTVKFSGNKSEVKLNNEVEKQCLYLYEAKMYSPLSSKTKNTHDNQMERYLKNAKDKNNHADKKFILIYPEKAKIRFNQNGSEEIREWVNCKEELLKVTTETYRIDYINILFISWEEIESDIIDDNYKEKFNKFYSICHITNNKDNIVKWPF